VTDPPRRRGLALALGLLGAPALLLAQKPAPRPVLDTLVARAVRDSLDPIAHYDLGAALAAAKKFDEAERECRAAVALAPQYADPYLALARLPAARGEDYWKRRAKNDGEGSVRTALLQAERYYRRAFLINPLVDLRVMADDDPRYRHAPPIAYVIWWWYRGMADAVHAVSREEYPRAFDALTRVRQDKRAGDGSELPSQVLWLRGLLGAQLGRYDESISDLDILTGRTFAAETTSARVGPTASANDYRYTLATVRYLAGRYDEAIATFRRSLEFDIGLYQAHIQMARMYESLKRWDDAIAERRAAIAADPDDGSLLVDLGGTLALAGRTEEAETVLGEATTQAPRDPRAWYLLGIAALRASHADAARAALTRFIAIAPSRYGEQLAEARQQLAVMP
jgi:tetratricopeptide (TPR) repeat protein